MLPTIVHVSLATCQVPGALAVLGTAGLPWLNLRLVFNYASNFIQAWLVFSQGYNNDCCSFFKKKFIQMFKLIINMFLILYFYSYFLEAYLPKCLYIVYQTRGNETE